MDDAGDQRLVGNPLLGRNDSNSVQILGRHPNIDSLVFLERVSSILLKFLDLPLPIPRRPPLALFIRIQDVLLIVPAKYVHVLKCMTMSALCQYAHGSRSLFVD